ncbi:non-specific ribonucleoside hydrolase rihC [Saitoella complicata NRRL Y-17804]|uniref:non-specific ribonucleoside hydrolase rihC n=1 Tax=Saitoella complicata (strain BCRC 22490 / CBS 7301 / JCM 7358 / NBRC 10748 / NRRL Y-17804) TaxID=698492 RepID=UPI00086798A9|nr:non-specific ribonucleoside hydrolase rihC [Saitoella complicata NRRL Y-17804]ODQ56527.1 non-specific ribonucleoside hydrolase rihC [Saitoella complicata NRRL Y-17804]
MVQDIWIDCDPGHDDAFALLLAGQTPEINVLGVSTVYGNSSLDHTCQNACRFLTAIHRTDIPVYKGASHPLLVPTLYAPNIHGESGLDGTNLLPKAAMKPREGKAIEAMAKAILSCQPDTCTLVPTGALTNIALLFAVYPEVAAHVKEVVIMGGAMTTGNVTSGAEFNIYCDPHAAQMVLNNPILVGKIVLVPLELTHTAIATPEVLKRMGTPRTPFRTMLVELATFFADTYARVFNVTSGPPMHDVCCIAYVLRPDSFETKLMRVDVVTAASEPSVIGRTVCHVWGQSDLVKNVKVAMKMDVEVFWEMVLDAVERADNRSIVNHGAH